MLLTIHLLWAAVILKNVTSLPLALFLVFLSHYLLDSLPHIEYPINNIHEKKWREAYRDFFYVALDILAGGCFILALFGKNIIFLSSSLAALLPDGLTLLYLIFTPSILEPHENFHRKIHFLSSQVKIHYFWKILTQFILAVLAILLLV